MLYNVFARVTRDCLCSGEFVATQKNSRRIRKFNGRLVRNSRRFRCTCPTPPHIRETKDSVPRRGNLPETKWRPSRRNLGSSLSLSRHVSFSFLHPWYILPLKPPLFPIHQLRELSESRDANLTCTTTNEVRRKRFERLWAWGMPSRLQSNELYYSISVYSEIEYIS